jgi:acetoin utilization deacetylase AcuC-like enzyme
MTTAMRRVAEELEAPLGMVLEGGYELGALARSVAATLEALSVG